MWDLGDMFIGMIPGMVLTLVLCLFCLDQRMSDTELVRSKSLCESNEGVSFISADAIHIATHCNNDAIFYNKKIKFGE